MVAIAVGVLLLLKATFSIWQPLSLTIPSLGTVDLSDVALLVLLYALFSMFRNREVLDRVDHLAIAIGFALLIASTLGVLTGDLQLRSLLRDTCRMAPLWMAVPVVRRMPDMHFRFLLKWTLALALLVSLVHAYVQLADRRDLMATMYYHISLDTDDPAVLARSRWMLRKEAYVRIIPDGALLMQAAAAGLFLLLVHPARRSRRLLLVAACAITYAGSLCNLTRSVALALCLLVPLLCLILFKGNRGIAFKVTGWLAAIVFASGTVVILNPAVLPTLQDRWSSILDESNPSDPSNARVQDSQQAMRELAQSPIWGNGSPRLREPQSEWGGDVHGLLAMGLFGGLPAVVLFVALMVAAVQTGRAKHDVLTTASLASLASMLFLMAVNTSGLVTASRQLVVLILTLAVMTRVPSKPRNHASTSHRNALPARTPAHQAHGTDRIGSMLPG